MCGSLSVFASEFDAANQKFKAGDFYGAANAYEEILTREGPRAAVFYNLGNSYSQFGKYAPAILAYERARLITPRDSDLLANLASAQKAASIEEDKFNDPWFNDILHYLSRNEWAWLVTGASLFLGCLSLIFGAMKLSRISQLWGLISASVAGVIIVVAAGALTMRHNESNRGVVLSEDAQVRLSPFEKAESVGQLKPGQSVTLGSRNGNFYYVESAGRSLEGWISKEDVALISLSFAPFQQDEHHVGEK
mgnify:CR=1 FL=1